MSKYPPGAHPAEEVFPILQLDLDEALRYLGAGSKAPPALRSQAQSVADALSRSIHPRFVYRVFPLEHHADGFSLIGTNLRLTGRTAQIMLSQCHQAALLACTLGPAFDAMLRTWQARDMAAAVMLDACGSAWVEAGCNQAEEELKARLPELYLTDRFSPGYGDLPLDLQPALCAALDAGRRLGLSVTDSLLLNPSKSVTAVIGLAHQPQMARVRGCAYCTLRETCALRKGGNHCEL